MLHLVRDLAYTFFKDECRRIGHCIRQCVGARETPVLCARQRLWLYT